MNVDNETYLGLLGVVLCLCAAIKLKNRRQRRRFKTRPINRQRRTCGNFHYYQKMKSWDAPQYFKFTRMSVEIFEKLLSFIKPQISRQTRSDGVSAEERLVITFQYLSQGSTMQSLAWSFNIGLTTVHQIIHETCSAIWETLSPLYLKTPSSPEEWHQIERGFHRRWNFPHCLGALDGKHVNIQAPANSGSVYYNYKKTFSIVLLASCDSTYRFTAVDIGAYGSQSDGGVFKNSIFGQRLEESSMNIPNPSNLPGSDIPMPYFLVGDEAFPLKKYIMRPYPGRNLSDKQRIFNYRLSRARQVIENTFGILVARWRILKTHIVAKIENVDNIVKAVAVLHNYCQTEMTENDMYCPAGYVDSGNQENGAWRDEQAPLNSVGRVGSNIARRELYAIRDHLADYFVSDDGQVAWQNDIIHRGRLAL